ncbi:MAG TPA: hypothetical protein VMV18_08060 [bacterium]|nr:hypothetical protein [bacterium]
MRVQALLLVSSLWVGAAGVTAGPSAAEVAAGKKLLAQAIAAAGGAKALAAIQDVTQSGSLVATMAGEDVDGSVTMIETRDGSTRDEMTLGGISMVSAAGPGGGFSIQAGIRKALSGNDLVQAQAQSRFTPLGLLLHGSEPDVVLRALPPEEGLDVLEVDPPAADPLYFYFDPKTHLVSKLKLVSRKDGTTLVTRYSQYRAEAGVQMPHELSLTQAGMAMVFHFSSVQLNTGASTGVAPEAAADTAHAAATAAAAAAAPATTAEPPHDAKPAAKPDATRPIAVTNHTGKTLNNLFVSVHDEKQWGASLLPVDKFHDGDTATLQVSTKGECLFDLTITDVEGHYWVVPGANFCTSHALTLRAGKSGLTFDSK